MGKHFLVAAQFGSNGNRPEFGDTRLNSYLTNIYNYSHGWVEGITLYLCMFMLPPETQAKGGAFVKKRAKRGAFVKKTWDMAPQNAEEKLPSTSTPEDYIALRMYCRLWLKIVATIN